MFHNNRNPDNPNPFKIERDTLTERQAELKNDPPLTLQGLDPACTDTLAYFQEHIHIPLPQLLLDAKTLYDFLTPSLQIQYGNIIEDDKVAPIQKNDALMLNGNNDLFQVDFFAALYRDANPKPKVYVSGFGGHGTMQHPIFGLTEGATMRQRLLDGGVDEKDLITEYDAIDTGRNAKYLNIYTLMQYTLDHQQELAAKTPTLGAVLSQKHIQFIQKMFSAPADQKRTAAEDEELNDILTPVKEHVKHHNIVIHPNIFISGTPAQLRRQWSTFVKQNTLPWQTISCVAPSWDYMLKYYYQNKHDTMINIFYQLREIASILDYTLNSEFLSSHLVADESKLKKAICVYLQFFNLFNQGRVDCGKLATLQFVNKHISSQRAAALAEKFILYSRLKNQGDKATPAAEKLKTELNRYLQPATNYYRRAFENIERVNLKHLHQRTTVREQSDTLDIGKAFGRLGLSYSAQFFYHKPKVKSKKKTQESNVKKVIG